MFGLAGIYFLAGGILALFVRSELAVPGMQVLSHQEYNEFFTMHGSTMVYLVVQPIALALGVYLVPLQIGAPDLAAPRLALWCVWMQLAGGVIMYLGFLTTHGAGPDGWTAFLPLSNATFTPGAGMDMWVLGVIVANAGQLVLAGVILATILLRRAPGVSMLRLPVFVWTEVVTTLMVLVSFPALIAAMALIYLRAAVRLERRPERLPEPVLVLRAPQRLCHVLPVPGVRRRGGRGVLRQAFLRVHGDGVLAARLRDALDERVGPPHVHHRPVGERVLRPHLDQPGRGGGRRVLRHGGDDVGRIACAWERRCYSRSPS